MGKKRTEDRREGRVEGRRSDGGSFGSITVAPSRSFQESGGNISTHLRYLTTKHSERDRASLRKSVNENERTRRLDDFVFTS